MIVVDARFLTMNMVGVVRFSMEISRRLKRYYGKEIEFVCPKNIVLKDYAKELNPRIIGHNKGFLWEQLDLLLYLKKRGNPLLISFFGISPILYFNKISTIHDLTYIRYPQTFTKQFRLFYRLFIPLVIKSSRHLFTVSEFSKKELCEYYHIDKKRIDVIYNGVDERFKKEKDEAIEKDNYILVPASGIHKNFIMATSAFLEATKDIPTAKIKLLGTKGCIKDSNICANNKVEYTGKIDDEQLIKLYSNAKAFVFPSFYEGFGIPVLEAQKCGCFVISSDAASLPEILKDSAILISPNNKSEYVNIIRKVYEETYDRTPYIELGYENAKRFSWEKSSEQAFFLINAFIKHEK